MNIDPWLPRGLEVLKGSKLKRVSKSDERWQIYDATGGRRILIVDRALADAWSDRGLLDEGTFSTIEFGARTLACIDGGCGYRVDAIEDSESPDDLSDCLAFAAAVRRTRSKAPDLNLGDAIYVERLSLVLPGLTPSPAVRDDIVLGYWLTGGVHVSISAERRIRSLAPWLGAEQLRSIAQAAGLVLALSDPSTSAAVADPLPTGTTKTIEPTAEFSLPGRPALQAFFTEHVIDIVRHEDRYRALGVGFPGAVLLHGPPGSGKTYAVDRLVDYLGWPRFSIEAGSIASPYIHETSRKIAETFKSAIAASPSVIVMDEIDAFLSERQGGVGDQHRVEEISEFLRMIPQASQNRVLLIGMTNRIEALDKAILRRGRFDHIMDVGMPTTDEVEAMLASTLAAIPHSKGIDIRRFAERLAGRPMSDAAFVVREACRLAARASSTEVAPEHFEIALAGAVSRDAVEPPRRRIGFI